MNVEAARQKLQSTRPPDETFGGVEVDFLEPDLPVANLDFDESEELIHLGNYLSGSSHWTSLRALRIILINRMGEDLGYRGLLDILQRMRRAGLVLRGYGCPGGYWKWHIKHFLKETRVS